MKKIITMMVLMVVLASTTEAVDNVYKDSYISISNGILNNEMAQYGYPGTMGGIAFEQMMLKFAKTYHPEIGDDMDKFWSVLSDQEFKNSFISTMATVHQLPESQNFFYVRMFMALAYDKNMCDMESWKNCEIIEL